LKILGYTNEQQVIGKNMHNLIHHTSPEGSKHEPGICKINNAYRKGRAMHSDDDIFWRADGTSFPVEYFSYPIRQNQKITGAVVSFQDISYRKKSEKELFQLKNDLEVQVNKRTAELREKVQKLDKTQKAMLYMVEDLNRMTAELKQERHKLKLSNEELEAFAYSVSHDLRAPLRAIEGFSQFLIEDYAEKLDDEGKRFIETIRQNTAAMDGLISDLLNLSRVSRVEMNPVRIDMSDLILSIYYELTTDEDQKIFEITIDKLPPVFCDVPLMKQVWRNLIGNAIKYSAGSSIKKIKVSAEESNENIVFCIKDYGAGFDERYVDKLFGVFQRLHKTKDFEGSGVGLAIVKRIIKRHSGEVWAEGKINQGAAFYFSLPR
jgi:PAS domain S-box-containing protein